MHLRRNPNRVNDHGFVMYSIQVGILPHTRPWVSPMGDVLKWARGEWDRKEHPAKRRKRERDESQPFGVTECTRSDVRSTAPHHEVVDTVISVALHKVIKDGGCFIPPHAFSNGERVRGHDILRGVDNLEAFALKYPSPFNESGTWKGKRIVVPIHRRAARHWMVFVVRTGEKAFEVSQVSLCARTGSGLSHPVPARFTIRWGIPLPRLWTEL